MPIIRDPVSTKSSMLKNAKMWYMKRVEGYLNLDILFF